MERVPDRDPEPASYGGWRLAATPGEAPRKPAPPNKERRSANPLRVLGGLLELGEDLLGAAEVRGLMHEMHLT